MERRERVRERVLRKKKEERKEERRRRKKEEAWIKLESRNW